MIGALSLRERMLVGGAVIGGVLMLGWWGIVAPIRDRYRTAGDLVPVREQLLGQRLDLVNRRAAITAELNGINQRLDAMSARFLPASTPAVAASELQKLIKDMATTANTEVRSERILPPVERGELLEVPIEIAVSGEIRQLVDLMVQIERAPKLLVFQDVKIRVVNITQPKDLLATLTLAGFIMPSKSRT
jgi:Tfp pilus assembly protein PilO